MALAPRSRATPTAAGCASRAVTQEKSDAVSQASFIGVLACRLARRHPRRRADFHLLVPGPTAEPALQPQPLSRRNQARSSRNPTRRTQVLRASATLWLRVVDETGAEPIAHAHVVIDNVNLAAELGDDSDAVTWPDGRAILSHKIFCPGRKPQGRQNIRARIIGRAGTLGSTSLAEGYEPKKMPLAKLPWSTTSRAGDYPTRQVVTLTNELRRTLSTSLPSKRITFLAMVSSMSTSRSVDSGRYHYKWQSDVIRDEPHSKMATRVEADVRSSMASCGSSPKDRSRRTCCTV